MTQIPDDPRIREAERYGMPPYDDPETTCPICGKDCETIFTDIYHEAVGCNECLTRWEPWEWWDENRKEPEP